ncbi:MAG TPA: hypothetical protein VF101_16980 [Gaiellaceae bacterium]
MRGAFERCAAQLSESGFAQFSLEVFTDEDVDLLLDGLERDKADCLVFASNATRSGQVADALARRRSDLVRYIGSGGGIVLLHVANEQFDGVLPAKVLPELMERREGTTRIEPVDADATDVLLHYPQPVDWRTLRDLAPEARDAAHASELPSVFFRAIVADSLPSSLKPVLRSADGDLVGVRTQDYVVERVVVVTLPLDWQANRPGQGAAVNALLANAINYACLGTPRRLVWHDLDRTSAELLLRWLALDGGAAIRPAPSGAVIDGTDKWLLANVDTFVLPEDRLPEAAEQELVKEFLAHGGTLVAGSIQGSMTRVQAWIGRYEEWSLASRLYAELRIVEGWRNLDIASAFDARNIASALAFLARDEVNPGDRAAIDPHVEPLAPLIAAIRDHLGDPGHREDLGSSIALAEALAHLAKPEPIDVDWMEEQVDSRPADVSFQIRAALALGRGKQVSEFLAAAAEAVAADADTATSIAPLVRVLDAVASLDEAELLEDDPAAAVALAEVACRLLARFPARAERGWMSVEATAELTRGLVILYRRLDPKRTDLTAPIVAHIATGATALRRARRRYTRGVKGVAWLARLTHALIVADRQFPIGLQRLASIEWPDGGAAPDARPSERGERTLLQDLAVTNESLRDELAQTHASLRAEQDRLAEARAASAIGRFVATAVPIAALAAATIAILTVIGWTTTQGVLANLAILLAAVSGLLAWVFGWLKRWHLLAGWADSIRGLAEKGTSAVSSASKLKRG